LSFFPWKPCSETSYEYDNYPVSAESLEHLACHCAVIWVPSAARGRNRLGINSVVLEEDIHHARGRHRIAGVCHLTSVTLRAGDMVLSDWDVATLTSCYPGR